MKKIPTESAQGLRQRAEKEVLPDDATVLQNMSLDDAQQQLHELRVHQVELEMQNEELRRTQKELGASRARYFDLYDLAPVGYLTLSARGLIQEANLAAATMLGVVRNVLLKKPITSFILPLDQDIYYLHRKRVFESCDMQAWEMRMLRVDGTSFWTLLRATPANNGEYWVTLTDITRRKQAEEHEQFRSRILELLAGAEPLPKILEAIVQGLEQVHPAMLCSILLLDSEGRHLVMGAAPSLPDFYNAAIDGIEIGIGAGSCGTAAFTGERVIVYDIETHPYWVHYRELAVRAGLGACWSEPIRSSFGQVLGTFAIYHHESHIPVESDIYIIEQSARLASIAIEKRVTEEKLQDTNKLLELFMHNSPIYTYIKEVTSTESRVLQASENFSQMVGIPGSKMVGKIMTELFPADLAAKITADDWSVVSSGHVLHTDENFNGRCYSTIKFPLVQRKKTLLAGYSLDITERKRAEDALRESRGKFKAYIDNSFDVIFALNAERAFLFVSRAWERHFGYSIRKVLGKNFALFVHPDDIPSCAEYLAQILRGGQSKTSPPYRVKRSDESWCWFITNGSRYLDTNNEWQFIGVARDITDQNESEQKLRQAKEAADAANIAKSDFLATMSHEIRTPLGTMLGNVELLEGSSLTPQQQEYLKDCKSASQMLLQIINDVLDFSKIEAGKLELVNETFAVSSMGRQLVRMFSAVAKKKGLVLTLSAADDLPGYISCDQQRLRQIISNLLSNAIKFTRHGTVSLEIAHEQASTATSPDKPVLRFAVRDTGIGIPCDKQDHIFESFTQLESFKARRESGTGLGLPICRRLLALMGGSISVSSVPGEGSAFTVLLPVTACKTPAQTQARIQVQATPRKILLADDDQRGRAVAQKLLQRKGYVVTAVENGAELLNALQQEEFEIVLTDISMPDIEGTQVARIIRSGERVGIDPHIPIIAMTAHAFAEDRERFLDAGINGYIAKPVNLEELFRQIEVLCSRAAK